MTDGITLEGIRLTGTGDRCRWIYLWPLAAQLAKDDTGAAIAAARQMLDPWQQALPDELAAALAAACHSWDSGDGDAGARGLADAPALAHGFHYF